MMVNFFGSYCKLKGLNCKILLEFQPERKKGNGMLHLTSLRFFKDTSSLSRYIEQNSLETINNHSKRPKLDTEPIFKLKEQIIEYGKGKKINLALTSQALNLLNIDALFQTGFSKKVIRYLIDNVKYGDTLSYSGIGRNIGSKAYQAIGTVLKNNPLPLIIPCHRVIRKDGTIGGFMGKTSENEGWEVNLKKKLLELET